MNVKRLHDRAAKVPSGCDQRSGGRDAIHGRNVMEVGWANWGGCAERSTGPPSEILGNGST